MFPLFKFVMSCLLIAILFVTDKHKEITKVKGGYLWWKSFGIDPECLCCAEWKDKISSLPLLQNGSRIKITQKEQQIFGICKWIGLINGVESVGIEMVDTTLILTNFQILLGE